MLKRSKVIIYTIAIIVVFSCRKDIKQTNWDVDLLAPLITTTLTLDNLLPDSILQTNPDTSLTLIYQTNIIDLEIDSLVKIPNVNISDTFNPPISLIVQPGFSLTSQDREEQINVSNGVELKSMIIESGFFELELFSEIQEKLVGKIVLPSATRNGDTLVVEGTVDAATASSSSFSSVRVDLSGYELDLTGSNQNSVNTFISRVTTSIDPNGSEVLITGGEEMILTGRLIDLVPRFARGFFGTQQITLGSATTNLNIFNRIVDGTLDIEQLDMLLTIENGIGVDLEFTVDQLETVNSNSNTNAVLNHSIVASPITIGRSQETFSIPEVILYQ